MIRSIFLPLTWFERLKSKIPFPIYTGSERKIIKTFTFSEECRDVIVPKQLIKWSVGLNPKKNWISLEYNYNELGKRIDVTINCSINGKVQSQKIREKIYLGDTVTFSINSFPFYFHGRKQLVFSVFGGETDLKDLRLEFFRYSNQNIENFGWSL